MMIDYLSSRPDWAVYQVSTKQGSGPSLARQSTNTHVHHWTCRMGNYNPS